MKISIIIPVYNGANFVEQRFKELDSYDNPEAEFIFVNDGSTDDTESLLRLGSNDPRIVVMNMEENKGVMNALTFGLVRASNDDVLTCDIDDPFSFSYLEGLKFDIEAEPPQTMITIPKQIFVKGKPNGQVWNIPQYEKPEQYTVALFINHSGLIALNNTIHKKDVLLKSCNEAIKLLDIIGVERMDYGEDSLRASIMIHQGLISHIVPSRAYTVPYTLDNSDSLSKDNTKIKRDLPVFIAYAYYCLYSQYEGDDTEEKNEFKKVFRDICRAKYGERASWFAETVEGYVEKMEKYYEKDET